MSTRRRTLSSRRPPPTHQRPTVHTHRTRLIQSTAASHNCAGHRDVTAEEGWNEVLPMSGCARAHYEGEEWLVGRGNEWTIGTAHLTFIAVMMMGSG